MMLLRRITEHVKAQNWFAVGLDFLIVVAGVFVGLQVSNWNASQADQRRGKVYAERLAGDLRTDLRKMNNSALYFDAVNEGAEETLRLLQEPAPDAKALVFNAYRATETMYLPPTRATWDEIVSSGEVSLLPREAVENGLTWYFAGDVGLQAQQAMLRSSYRARVRRLIPHAVQTAIRANCSDVMHRALLTISLRATCDMDVSDALFTETASAIREDGTLIEDLRLHFSALSSSRDNFRGQVVTLERIIGVLEGDAARENEGAQQ